MKKIIILLTVMFALNTLTAQYIKIDNKDGSAHFQAISTIENITFPAALPSAFSTCGDLVLYEGKYYETVQIGDQCWFKENLNVGTMINSTAADSQQTNNSIIEKYCYGNDEANCNTYGGLYEWGEAMQYATAEVTQGICPSGWHIPTEDEMNTLKTFVSDDDDGSPEHLVEEGEPPAPGKFTPDNSTGFSGLYAGQRIGSDGLYYNLGSFTSFWSSEYLDTQALRLRLYSQTPDLIIYMAPKSNGYSIRCLKD